MVRQDIGDPFTAALQLPASPTAKALGFLGEVGAFRIGP
jgi:hypothetical protein